MKISTSLPHRFGKTITFGEFDITFDAFGYADVKDEQAFELTERFANIKECDKFEEEAANTNKFNQKLYDALVLMTFDQLVELALQAKIKKSIFAQYSTVEALSAFLSGQIEDSLVWNKVSDNEFNTPAAFMTDISDEEIVDRGEDIEPANENGEAADVEDIDSNDSKSIEQLAAEKTKMAYDALITMTLEELIGLAKEAKIKKADYKDLKTVLEMAMFLADKVEF